MSWVERVEWEGCERPASAVQDKVKANEEIWRVKPGGSGGLLSREANLFGTGSYPDRAVLLRVDFY
jgi:hypothetical protein